MQVTTPSGYVVVFKDEADLTYRDKRKIQKSFLSTTSINQKNAGEIDLKASVIYEAQDELLKIILLEVKQADGTLVSGNLFDYVNDKMPEIDAEAVYKVVTDTLSTSKLAKN